MLSVREMCSIVRGLSITHHACCGVNRCLIYKINGALKVHKSDVCERVGTLLASNIVKKKKKKQQLLALNFSFVKYLHHCADVQLPPNEPSSLQRATSAVLKSSVYSRQAFTCLQTHCVWSLSSSSLDDPPTSGSRSRKTPLIGFFGMQTLKELF